MVSTDGGKSYAPVAGSQTVAGPLGPGITGTTGGAFVEHAYNLSAYAGTPILLGFRYVSDAGVNEGGWLIKDISIGAQPVSSDRSHYRSPTQVRPVVVHAFHVRLVGLSADGSRVVRPGKWRALAGYDKVVAVVAYDEPTAQITRYAPYSLTVNGVRQPG
jgi:hypothetical protein